MYGKFPYNLILAEMGLRRIIHASILKYTRENYCTTICLNLNDISFFQLTIKVNQSCYRSGVTQKFPGSYGSQIT